MVKIFKGILGIINFVVAVIFFFALLVSIISFCMSPLILIFEPASFMWHFKLFWYSAPICALCFKYIDWIDG